MNTPADREEEILEALRHLASPKDREEYLQHACAGNAALRESVESLYRALQEGESLFKRIREAKAPPERIAEIPLSEMAGTIIGRYKLEKKLGEGGFGVVWEAEQQEPIKRRVALKVIKLGMDTQQVIARFESERQTLAIMDHPNIARVLDAGATDSGRPYFVMELVNGIPITQYCAEQNLDVSERVNLFIRVCHATQHAHQKGIIHRDIKPSNVLITLQDGKPAPKVIDFGIAKATQQELTERTIFTQSNHFIGTPAYMSPEQAEMTGEDIDTRSDIYSLGVLLYELLAGSTPFDTQELLRSGLDQMRKIIREREPARPSTRLTQSKSSTPTHSKIPILKSQIENDLDWIVMKCLEKDRARRYDTANGMAMDLERFRNNEPVVARPPSVAYKVRKAWRRNKVIYTAGLAVVAALLTGLKISLWQASVAVHSQHVAERNLYTADIFATHGLLNDGNFGAAKTLLELHIPEEDQKDLRGWEWRYFASRLRRDYRNKVGEHTNSISGLAVSRKGDLLLSGDQGGTLKLWDLTSNLPEQRNQYELNRPVVDVGFSATGKHIAVSINDYEGKFVTVFSIDSSGDFTRTWSQPAFAFGFAPRSERIAIIHTNWTVEIKDLTSGDSRWLDAWLPTELPKALGGFNTCILWSNDESFIVSTGPRRRLRGWRLASGSYRKLIESAMDITNSRFLDGCVLPDNETFVTTGPMGPEFWKFREDGFHLEERTEHRGLAHLDLSREGDLLAFAGLDHTLRVWGPIKRRKITQLHGHSDEVWEVVISPDGKTIYTSAQDGEILEWDANWKQRTEAWSGNFGHRLNRVWSADGRHLAVEQKSGRPLLIETASGSRTQLGVVGMPIAFSADGQNLHLAELKTTGPPPLTPTGRLFSVDVNEPNSPTHWRGIARPNLFPVAGRSSALMCVDRNSGRQLLIDVDSGEVRDTLRYTPSVGLPYANFSPDGNFAVTWNFDAWTELVLTVWNLVTVKQVATLRGHIRGVAGAAFSPDGQFFATAGTDSSIRLWETDTWTLAENGILEGHKRGTHDVTFAPDGKTLASCNDDGTVKLWNVETRGQMASFQMGNTPASIGFSPDGRNLIVICGPTANDLREIRILRAPLFEEID